MKIYKVLSVGAVGLLIANTSSVQSIHISNHNAGVDTNSKKLLAAATAINKIQKSKEAADEAEALKEVRKIITNRDKKEDDGVVADKVVEKEEIKEIKKQKKEEEKEAQEEAKEEADEAVEK